LPQVANVAWAKYGDAVFLLGEWCPALIELSDAQVFWLRRRPSAIQPVRRHHECRLEYRHDGPHGDICQQGEEVEWWVRWTLTSSAIDQVTACPVSRAEPEEPHDDLTCVLFEGHPGRHSYDLDQR